MSYILDIVCIAVLAIVIIASWKKGFIKAVLGFAAVIVSVVGAKIYAPALGAWLDETIINSKLKEVFLKNITSGDRFISAKNNATSLFSGLHKYFPRISADEMIDAGADKVKTAADSLIGTISSSLSEIAAFVLLFIGLFLVCKIIIAVLNAVFKLPGLGVINHGLGLILGIAKGVLFVFVICLLVSFAGVMMASSSEPVISPEVIADTYVFKIFYNNNLLLDLLF